MHGRTDAQKNNVALAHPAQKNNVALTHPYHKGQ